MNRIRIKTDFTVRWSILTRGEATSLEGRDLRLEMHTPAHVTVLVPFTVEDNVVVIRIAPEMQTHVGVYSFTLWENHSKAGQAPLDKCSAFHLVSKTCKADASAADNIEVMPALELGTDDMVFAPISLGGGSIEIDAELSLESENAVQNKVVTQAINNATQKAEAAQNTADTNKNTLATLMGNGQGSIAYQIAQAIAAIVADAPEAFDTLKEIADYIASDKTGAAELNNRISEIATAIANETTRATNEEKNIRALAEANKAAIEQLAGVEDGGSVVIVVDPALSETSENPVQNKAVTAGINEAKAAAQGAQGTADDAMAAVEAETSRAKGIEGTLQEGVTANTSAINTLKGTGAGSIDAMIAAAIDEFAAKVSDDGTINTFKELIDYAATHGSEFSELVGEVDAQARAIATLNGDATIEGSVLKIVADAIAAEVKRADEAYDAKGAASTAEQNAKAYTDGKLNDKVDKVDGKQLSTEDFTTALKAKLSGLSNYDDTAINNAVSSLQTQLNTLVSGDANTAIESFNEIIAFLNGIEDSENLDSIIASIEQQIASKQDAISDLATIRSGAAAGATAVQPSSLSAVATSGSYKDLSDKPSIPAEQVNADWNATSGKAQILNKPTIPTVPTNVSAFTNDAGYITEEDIPDTSEFLDQPTADGLYQPLGVVSYPEVSHTEATAEIAPNTMHVWGEVTALTLTLGAEEEGCVNEYAFQFTSGATATTLTLPSTLTWANGEALAPEANKTYQVSIVNGYAVYSVF